MSENQRLHCSCGQHSGFDGEPIHMQGQTHRFDGGWCFTRCEQIGIYTMVKPGVPLSTEMLRVDTADSLVTCKLPKGHEGPHEYPDIPGAVLSERAD